MPAPKGPWDAKRIAHAKRVLAKHTTLADAARELGISPSPFAVAMRHHGVNPVKLLRTPPATKPPPTDIGAARERQAQRVTAADVRALQSRLIEAEQVHEFYTKLHHVPTVPVRGSEARTGKRSATPVTIASDWHFGEVVTREETLGRNHYDLAEARRRAANFWDNVMWLRRDAQRTCTAQDHVLVLNGDMISGSIHEELTETNEVGRVEQVCEVSAAIEPGIKALAADSRKLLIVCTHGNHGRITDKSRIKTGWANSLETLLYRFLRKWSQDVGLSNIEWVIPKAENVAVDVMGWRLQVQHGTQIKSQGGIGGILVPLTRWATRSASANYYLFGHFHQAVCYDSIVVNGSLIGESAYSTANAMGGKAGKERPPEQVNFVIDEKRGLRRFDPVSVT